MRAKGRVAATPKCEDGVWDRRARSARIGAEAMAFSNPDPKRSRAA
jgi:hypothetical protein